MVWNTPTSTIIIIKTIKTFQSKPTYLTFNYAVWLVLTSIMLLGPKVGATQDTYAFPMMQSAVVLEARSQTDPIFCSSLILRTVSRSQFPIQQNRCSEEKQKRKARALSSLNYMPNILFGWELQQSAFIPQFCSGAAGR